MAANIYNINEKGKNCKEMKAVNQMGLDKKKMTMSILGISFLKSLP